MAFKQRSESLELVIYRYLNARMILSANEKWHYYCLEKGYQGELMFDQLTEKLENDLYIINDLCLKWNNSFFQIDSLIISEKKIYPFEVKNYEGNYYFDSGGFFSKSSKEEVKNPLDQLKRINSLLHPQVKKLGIFIPLEGFVTFVNPEFTLYQAPLNAPIYYPTQLHQLMKKLNQVPSKLDERHKRLADQLISLNQIDSPYTQIPSYKYDQLTKGILCPRCYSFMHSMEDKKMVCPKCGCEEKVDYGVLRSVKELMILFPDKKITTNGIHEWCGVVRSKKTIRRILLQNYLSIGTGNHRYFE